jgi:hypothetical protein
VIGCSPVQVHPVVATTTYSMAGFSTTWSMLTVTQLTVVGWTSVEAATVKR